MKVRISNVELEVELEGDGPEPTSVADGPADLGALVTSNGVSMSFTRNVIQFPAGEQSPVRISFERVGDHLRLDSFELKDCLIRPLTAEERAERDAAFKADRPVPMPRGEN